MNSPPDPGSPSPTTPSSGSPPPDEFLLPSSSSQIEPIPMFLSSPSSKRPRNAPTSSRDAKSRRRDDSGPSSSISGRRAGHGYGGSQESGRQKDDLVDNQLAETLKRQYGDPFDDSILKRNA